MSIHYCQIKNVTYTYTIWKKTLVYQPDKLGLDDYEIKNVFNNICKICIKIIEEAKAI